ncbi:hypothetical protein ACCO45_006860 [Purpureocillium lilacinum]|uniref:Uncharacterized protein n=1 Tax=Purpureocillium lilacinum TaxID=33203 RepID=A0ACC4DRR0_PURLI
MAPMPPRCSKASPAALLKRALRSASICLQDTNYQTAIQVLASSRHFGAVSLLRAAAGEPHWWLVLEASPRPSVDSNKTAILPALADTLDQSPAAELGGGEVILEPARNCNQFSMVERTPPGGLISAAALLVSPRRRASLPLHETWNLPSITPQTQRLRQAPTSLTTSLTQRHPFSNSAPHPSPINGAPPTSKLVQPHPPSAGAHPPPVPARPLAKRGNRRCLGCTGVPRAARNGGCSQLDAATTWSAKVKKLSARYALSQQA